MPDSDDAPPRQFKLKPKEFERVNAPPGTQEKSADHDVFAIREDLRQREIASGMDNLEMRPPRKSRRKRDYWLLMLAANTGFAVLAVTGRNNPVTFVSAIAGIALISTALTWVMWFIMDDY